MSHRLYNGVWSAHMAKAGQVTYSGAQVQAITDATYNFANYVTDPKAAIITTYDYIGGTVSSRINV